MENVNCCTCGVRVYMDEGYYLALRRDKKAWYCLNGHPQEFSRNDTDILKEQYKIIDDTKNGIINDLKRKLDLVENRLTCAICRKKFTCKGNLTRHIKKKHPIKKKGVLDV